MKKAKIKPYYHLARHYDEIFGRQAFATRAQKTLLGTILPYVKSACDLACGTGNTALKLAQRGIRVFAVDLSSHMCSEARGKASAAGLSISVFRADMRNFRLPESVDLVLCEFDALNHVPRKTDLAKVVQAVARALRPGGHFFFDVNNRKGFQSYWKGVWRVEKPGFVLFMSNGNNAPRDRAWCDCDWFIRQGKLWRRYHERIEEVCWTRAEVYRALRQAGFNTIRHFDSTPFFKAKSLIKPGCRTHYLAQKSMK